MNGSQEFDWLETPFTGLENRVNADIMREGGQQGKDRVWWCDGEYIWFRRSKSNPATLKRHNDFVADGDYQYIETSNDVELWQVKAQSQFATKKGQLDIGVMDTYNLRRQASLAACRRDWKGFRDIMSYLRERIRAVHGSNTGGSEMEYAEQFMAVVCSIEQRDGPSMGEINREIFALSGGKKGVQSKVIDIVK